MPITLKPTIEKSDIVRMAIQNSIKILNETPEILAHFLTDITKGEHKKWTIYKTEYSKVVSDSSKGRPEPGTRKSGIPIARTERQAKMYRNWGAIHTPSLNLGKYHNPTDKIKAILRADCAPQIKAELLESVDTRQE